jgi:hypothetical protein
MTGCDSPSWRSLIGIPAAIRSKTKIPGEKSISNNKNRKSQTTIQRSTNQMQRCKQIKTNAKENLCYYDLSNLLRQPIRTNSLLSAK